VVYDALMETILDKLKGIMNANPILIDVRGSLSLLKQKKMDSIIGAYKLKES